MNMLVVWCMSLFLIDGESTSPAVNNPSAWIAVLRDYERQHGRDAWSYQELSEARASVLDPFFTVKTSSAWFHQLSLLYFRYYPILVLTVSVLCCGLAWKYYSRNKWAMVMLANLLWFFSMWIALLPMQPSSATSAVIKVPGTVLREGNGLSYQETIHGQIRFTLAAGVEAELISEAQNGWVKIRLADGTAGWAPMDAVYLVK